MGINGVRSYEVVLPPEADAYYLQQFTDRQLAVFGAERLAEAANTPPSPELVDALIWRAEEVGTGPQSHRFEGVSTRTIVDDTTPGRADKLSVTWNSAGTMGGFDVDTEWEGAPLSIGYKDCGRTWAAVRGGIPRAHRVLEGFYLSRHTAEPRIRRILRPLIGRNKSSIVSSKVASAGEVEAYDTLLTQQLDKDRSVNQASVVGSLPVYLEVGYGLDPMALQGRREFRTRIATGIDRAVGAYENNIGAYPDAVRTQTREFVSRVAREKAGQHVAFVVGDATSSPFRDGSIRELFMSNIINAPLGDEVRAGILRDARRIIEPTGGNLVLRVNWHQDEWPHDQTVAFLHRAGFRVVRSVDQADSEYSLLEDQYGKTLEVKAPEGYYVIAAPA